MRLISCMIGGGQFEMPQPVWDTESLQGMRLNMGTVESCYESAISSLGIDSETRREHFTDAQAEQVSLCMQESTDWRSVLSNIVRRSLSLGSDYEAGQGKLIEIPYWNELLAGATLPFFASSAFSCANLPVVLNLSTGSTVDIGPATWHVVHSYIALLQRKLTSFRGGRRTCVSGSLTITSDKMVVVGERGGRYQRGFLDVVPGGSLGLCSERENLLRELEEELGVSQKDLSGEPRMIGVVEDDTGKVVFCSIIELKLHSREIRERWQGAKDAWEHVDVQCIPVDPRVLSPEYLCREYARLTEEDRPFMPLAACVVVTAAAALFGAGKLLGHFSNEEEISAYL